MQGYHSLRVRWPVPFYDQYYSGNTRREVHWRAAAVRCVAPTAYRNTHCIANVSTICYKFISYQLSQSSYCHHQDQQTAQFGLIINGARRSARRPPRYSTVVTD